jgi:hypothetical protein
LLVREVAFPAELYVFVFNSADSTFVKAAKKIPGSDILTSLGERR